MSHATFDGNFKFYYGGCQTCCEDDKVSLVHTMMSLWISGTRRRCLRCGLDSETGQEGATRCEKNEWIDFVRNVRYQHDSTNVMSTLTLLDSVAGAGSDKSYDMHEFWEHQGLMYAKDVIEVVLGEHTDLRQSILSNAGGLGGRLVEAARNRRAQWMRKAKAAYKIAGDV